MGLPRRQLLLPGLAVFGLVVVGFLSLARRDGMTRPTQLRAHQQQQTLSVEVLESASFETGMDALGEGGMDEIDESPGEQTGVEQAGVVGGEGPLNIKYVALIAERHSGSTWMVQFLQGYFKGKDIQVTATLCTWKHWFQDRIHEDLQDGKRSCRAMQKCPACLDIGHTLVIAMWRNPYDWMSGMNRLPHHAKAHVDMDLPSFMQKRWMLDAKPEQKARVDALMKVKNETPCLDSFLPWEVVPCRENDRSAIYELDENGEAYDNLYELRKAKIRDFNAVEAWAPYYEKILYEDMLTGTGLKDWLTSLEKTYGLYGKSGEVPSASLSKEMASSRAGMYYLNSKKCAPRCTMGGEDGTTAVKILHGMWDEKLESGLGYHQVGAPQKRM